MRFITHFFLFTILYNITTTFHLNNVVWRTWTDKLVLLEVQQGGVYVGGGEETCRLSCRYFAFLQPATQPAHVTITVKRIGLQIPVKKINIFLFLDRCTFNKISMITFIMYNYVKLNKFISKIPFPQYWFRNQKKTQK